MKLPIKDQYIMAVRRGSLPDQLNETGFHPMDAGQIENTLNCAEIWFGPRKRLENDAAYRQIVPYLLLAKDAEIVRYERSKKGAEERLHNLVSVGIGGHVDLADACYSPAEKDLRVMATLQRTAEREFFEEVAGVRLADTGWVGFVVEDDSAVGRVHLGVVALWDVTGDVRGHNAELEDVRFTKLEGLNQVPTDLLEPWTKILLPHLPALLGLP